MLIKPLTSFPNSGHGKPVDMWAIGVISYFLLAGYTPFDRDSTAQEMQAIVNGDYSFEPEVYWQGVSPSARDFINKLLTVDPSKRMTANEALEHQWLSTDAAKQEGEQKDLLPGIRSAFNAKMTFRKAVHGIRSVEHEQIGNPIEQSQLKVLIVPLTSPPALLFPSPSD